MAVVQTLQPLNVSTAQPRHDEPGRTCWLPRQAVVLLPFIEESRLLDAVAPLEKTLNPEEAARNGRRVDQLYVSTAHPLAPEAFEVLFTACKSDQF